MSNPINPTTTMAITAGGEEGAAAPATAPRRDTRQHPVPMSAADVLAASRLPPRQNPSTTRPSGGSARAAAPMTMRRSVRPDPQTQSAADVQGSAAATEQNLIDVSYGDIALATPASRRASPTEGFGSIESENTVVATHMNLISDQTHHFDDGAGEVADDEGPSAHDLMRMVSEESAADVLEMVDEFIDDLTDKAKSFLNGMGASPHLTGGYMNIGLESQLRDVMDQITSTLYNPLDPADVAEGVRGRARYDARYFHDIVASGMDQRRSEIERLALRVDARRALLAKTRERDAAMRERLRRESATPALDRDTPIAPRFTEISVATPAPVKPLTQHYVDDQAYRVSSGAHSVIEQTIVADESDDSMTTVPSASPVKKKTSSRDRIAARNLFRDEPQQELRVSKKTNDAAAPTKRARKTSKTPATPVKHDPDGSSPSSSDGGDSDSSAKTFKTALTRQQSKRTVATPALIAAPSGDTLSLTTKALPPFTGNADDDVDQWIALFAPLAEGLPERQQQLLLQTAMTGRARDWYKAQVVRDAQKKKMPGVDDWLRRMKAEFVIKDYVRRQNESSYRQRIDQSAQDYVDQKLRLIDAAFPNMDESSKVHQLSMGVHRVYRTYMHVNLLMRMSDKDMVLGFREMLEKAMDDFRVRGDATGGYAEHTMIAADTTGNVAAGIQNMTMSSTTPAPPAMVMCSSIYFHPTAQRMVAPNECLNCLAADHYLRDCPHPRREGLPMRQPNRAAERQSWSQPRQHVYAGNQTTPKTYGPDLQQEFERGRQAALQFVPRAVSTQQRAHDAVTRAANPVGADGAAGGVGHAGPGGAGNPAGANRPGNQ